MLPDRAPEFKPSERRADANSAWTIPEILSKVMVSPGAGAAARGPPEDGDRSSSLRRETATSSATPGSEVLITGCKNRATVCSLVTYGVTLATLKTLRDFSARDSEKKKRWTAEAAPSGYTRASDRCDSSNGRVPDSCCCNSSTGIKLDR